MFFQNLEIHEEVENVSIEYVKEWVDQYIPNYKYLNLDSTHGITFTATDKAPINIHLNNFESIIIATYKQYKKCYDEALVSLKEYLKFYSDLEYVDDVVKDFISYHEKYDKSFFDNNSLVITGREMKHSSSIKREVTEVYYKGNVLHVLVKTSNPFVQTTSLGSDSFYIEIPKCIGNNLLDIKVHY